MKDTAQEVRRANFLHKMAEQRDENTCIDQVKRSGDVKKLAGVPSAH